MFLDPSSQGSDYDKLRSPGIPPPSAAQLPRMGRAAPVGSPGRTLRLAGPGSHSDRIGALAWAGQPPSLQCAMHVNDLVKRQAERSPDKAIVWLGSSPGCWW